MITAELLRTWNACWSDEQIAAKLGNRTSVSPREVAEDESISQDDRLWVLCRALWHLDERAARLYAIETALSVAHLAGDEDDEAQFRGLMNDLIAAEDLDLAARVAVYDAVYDAARAAGCAAWDARAAGYAARAAGYAARAAWNAARDAATDAAYDAAWASAWDAATAAGYAARAAAYDAAYNAAYDAAWDAAIAGAILRALEWLGEYADGWKEADGE